MAIVAEREPNNGPTNANAITLGDSVRGALSSASDWDYFKVTVAAGGVLRLDFTSPVSSAADYFNVIVYDATGRQLAYDFIGSSTRLDVGAPAAGTYYVAVTSGSAHYSAAQYGLSASMAGGSAGDYESESNGSIATADPIVVAHTIKGQLSSSSDEDFYRVTANSAGVLVVDFSAPHSTAETSCSVAIYDQDGNLLQTGETGNGLSLVVPVAAAGSDYLIKVSQGLAINFDSGNYSFTAHNDGLATLAAKPLSGSGSISLTLSAGHDWYAVNLVAGTSYEFAVAGASSGGGTLADPALTLCYANGTALASCDNLPVWDSAKQATNTVADPQIAFTAPVTGTYYLLIAGNGGTGSYALSQKTDTLSALVQDLLHLQDEPNYRWNGGASAGTPVALSYSFMSSAADGATDDGEAGFRTMTSAQQQIVRNVLAGYAAVANITFTQTSDQAAAQLRFGTSNQANSSGITYTSTLNSGALEQADVFLDNSAGMPSLSAGSYELQTLIHEIGHALGLKHPGNYNPDGGGAPPPYLPAAWENTKYTAMSYVDSPQLTVYANTPSLLDIAAVQYLYGANTSGTGQAHTYAFSKSSPFVSSLLSSGSNDTIDISNQTLASIVLMTPGSLSSIGVDANGARAKDNVAVPFGANVAGVIDGPAADLIVGNALDNIFQGFAGANTIDGGAGSNALVLIATSSSFNSALDGQLSNVQTIDASAASAAVNLDAHRQSEALTLLGSAYADSLVLGSGGGTISGGAGNDTLTGGAGADIAVYAGNRKNFTTTSASVGQHSVADQAGTLGIDALVNIDGIRYADGAQNLNIAGDARLIEAGQLDSLTELYIAYFNRVPEASGLDYWIKQLVAGKTLEQIGSSFYEAATSADYAALTEYSPTMSPSAFVTKIYQNVLGRSTPDPEGLDYWSKGLTDGSKTRGTLISFMLDSAHTFKDDPTWGWVADLLDNKVSVGKYHAVTAGVDYLTPQEAVSMGMGIARLITATDTSAAINLIGLAEQVPYVA